MIIAIPVKPDSKDRNKYKVSNAFGKARFFAVVNDDNIEIIKTEETGGKNIAKLLKNNDVNIVLTPHLGRGAFNAIKNLGIKVYAVPANIFLEDALTVFKEGYADEIKEKNLNKFSKHDLNHK